MSAAYRGSAAAGLLSLATFGRALYALSLDPVAVRAALRETGRNAATMISITILKAGVTMNRIAAMITILVGAILILL